MKQKLSVSLEEDTIKRVEAFAKDRTFRNKSHLIEVALLKFMEAEDTEE